jgi:3-phenylpropionate/trans-cinnamate dioxygenase ferredoxin subunit
MAGFVAVALRDELPPGRVKLVAAGGVRIALCNAGGSIYAIEDRCSHDDGPLGEGALAGAEIECPRHGARFDLASGTPRCLPAVLPVRTFPVRVEGDQILVAAE